jgi:hypothetical protein
MADFVGFCVIAILVLSPLLRRLYFEHFWVHASGTVIRVEGEINPNPGAGGAWVWTPVIEYHAAGRQFSSRFSYWQLLNAKPKYAVGDVVEILYSPRNPARFILNSWIEHIVYAIFISGVIIGLSHGH